MRLNTARINTGRIQDARGRTVTQIDPVKLHRLNNSSVIPPAALRAISEELLPCARNAGAPGDLIAHRREWVLTDHAGRIQYFADAT